MSNILLVMAMQFQQIIALPSHAQISVYRMLCASNAKLKSRKSCRNIENSCNNIGNLSVSKFCHRTMYWCSCVVNCPCDGNAIILKITLQSRVKKYFCAHSFTLEKVYLKTCSYLQKSFLLPIFV